MPSHLEIAVRPAVLAAPAPVRVDLAAQDPPEGAQNRRFIRRGAGSRRFDAATGG